MVGGRSTGKMRWERKTEEEVDMHRPNGMTFGLCETMAMCYCYTVSTTARTPTSVLFERKKMGLICVCYDFNAIDMHVFVRAKHKPHEFLCIEWVLCGKFILLVENREREKKNTRYKCHPNFQMPNYIIPCNLLFYVK